MLFGNPDGAKLYRGNQNSYCAIVFRAARPIQTLEIINQDAEKLNKCRASHRRPLIYLLLPEDVTLVSETLN